MPLDLSQPLISAEGSPALDPGRFIGETLDDLDIAADALEHGEADTDPIFYDPLSGQPTATAMPVRAPAPMLPLARNGGGAVATLPPKEESKTIYYVGGGLLALGLLWWIVK
jgi:hypothetical protein